MVLSVIREITEWGVSHRQPNHIYLMDNDKALGYIKWGEGNPEYFKQPMRIDKKGRKFEILKNNPFTDYIPIKEVNRDKIVKVTGSTGAVYEVNITKRTCTCPAAKFRHNECKHIKQVCGEIGE